MIQIIAYRDYFDRVSNSWDTGHKLLMETEYETVGQLMVNIDSVLSKIPSEEKYNLHYTLANCLAAPRQFKSQTVIPIDIDDIEQSQKGAYMAIVSECLQIPLDEMIQVSSGNGLHILIETDKTIEESEEISAFRKSYKIVCDTIQNEISKSGLSGKVDPNVYRVSGTLRLPGTINRCLKKKPIQYPDTNCELISSSYKLQSFAKILGDRELADQSESIDSRFIRSFPLPDSDYVIKECRFIDWNFTEPEKVSEPEWYAALSIVGNLENGKQLAHKMSSGHPHYTYADTESKLSQAMGSSGPRTCSNIDSISDKCKTCPHFGKVTSPILLKGPNYISTAGTGFWIIGPDKNGNPKPLKPAYEDLRRYFEKKYRYVSTSSRQIWVYETPVWRELKHAFVEEFAQQHFSPRPNASQVAEFLKLVLRTNVVSDSWFDEMSVNKVNLSNGVIDMDTMEFQPHDKKFGFKYVLNHEYDQDAKCPRFDSFMKEVTMGREELKNVLLEYMAYAISGMPYIYHKALILTGEGSNGKSVFVGVLKKLVGSDAYSSLLSNQFESDYYRASMVGKLFNIGEETPSKKTDSSYFKILSSGGTYQAREPYGQPIHVENSKTKLIMACNELPEIGDFSDGFIRRLLIVPFDAKFTKETADPRIHEKLQAELPGIFNRIIEAYKRLKQNDGFTSSKVIEQTIEDYKEINMGSVVTFTEAFCVVDPEKAVGCKEFFIKYAQYCRDNGWKVESSNKVGRDLGRFFRVRSKVFRNNGLVDRKYLGVALRDPEGVPAF